MGTNGAIGLVLEKFIQPYLLTTIRGGSAVNKKHWSYLRTALLGSSAVALMAAPAVIGSSAALAQDDDAVDEEIEEVLVTGSRIRRAGFDTLQPAVTVDSDFIDERGFTNVAQALNQIPAFGIPGNSNFGQQSSQSVGQNFVNAFGLGSNRTLTLINGRRTVGQNTPTSVGAGAAAGLQVDLNIIPTALIDRIETIFIGGAPIYGSDAIAATVNIILKDDFEGFSADTQFSVSQRGDTQNYRIRGLWGGNFADGRGNATISAEFVTQKALDGPDRQQALDNWGFCSNPANTGPADGIPDTLFCKDTSNVWQVPNTGLPLSVPGLAFPPDGANALVNANGDRLVFDVLGNLITFEEANFGTLTSVFFSQGAGCGTNPIVLCLPETNTLVSPLDRWIITGNSHYQITDNTRVFIETLYARSDSSDNINQPPWSIVVFGPGAQGLLQMDITDNPFISQETKDILILNGVYDPTVVDDPTTTDDNQFFWMNRSNNDIVKGRPNTRTQNVLRIATGFEGDLDVFGNTWNWDAYYIFGITDAFTAGNNLNGIRYGMSLDAVLDADGKIVCRVIRDGAGELPQDKSQVPAAVPSDVTECLPFNPFGSDRNGQDVLDYLVQQQMTTVQIRQQVMEANISGDLFELPAGPVAIAAGVTHRREDGKFRSGQGLTLGIDPSSPRQNVTGAFNTYEIYGETLVPLIEGGEGFFINPPMIESIWLEGAIRLVDNNFAGKDVTWTLGGRMRMDLPLIGQDLLLRGNFTQSIRSPAIPELFLPTSDIFTFAQDPCDPRFIIAGPQPATRAANCAAEFASFIGAAGNGLDGDGDGVVDPANQTLADFVSIIVNASQPATTGGNLDLENEIADSWTVGGILTPSMFPGLTISIDWTSITLNNAIISISGTQLLNACYDNTQPNSACIRFSRDQFFQILDPELGFFNAAVREFSGMVANFTYQLEVADIQFLDSIPGSLDVSGNFFYTNKHQQTVNRSDIDVFDGERRFERFRMQLNLRYSVDDLSILWQTLHVSGGVFSNEATDERRDISRFPANRIHNMSITYQLTDNLRTRFVINNVFDNIDAPLLASSKGGNSNLFQDIVGRRVIFGITADY